MRDSLCLYCIKSKGSEGNEGERHVKVPNRIENIRIQTRDTVFMVGILTLLLPLSGLSEYKLKEPLSSKTTAETKHR